MPTSRPCVHTIRQPTSYCAMISRASNTDLSGSRGRTLLKLLFLSRVSIVSVICMCSPGPWSRGTASAGRPAFRRYMAKQCSADDTELSLSIGKLWPVSRIGPEAGSGGEDGGGCPDLQDYQVRVTVRVFQPVPSGKWRAMNVARHGGLQGARYAIPLFFGESILRFGTESIPTTSYSAIDPPGPSKTNVARFASRSSCRTRACSVLEPGFGVSADSSNWTRGKGTRTTGTRDFKLVPGLSVRRRHVLTDVPPSETSQ